MCGRYVFWKNKPAGEMLDLLENLNRRSLSLSLKAEGEIFPSDITPVIANSRRLEPMAFPMQWGYRLPGKGLIINARSETALSKPLFRDGLMQHRCLLPMDCYFEWDRSTDPKQKYAIAPAQAENCFLAGIYRIRDGQGEFAVLTRAPAENIAFIHDRMPVLLPQSILHDWLNLSNPPQELLQQAITKVSYQAVS